MSQAGVVHEPGVYRGQPAQAVVAELRQHGYRPLLISELPGSSLATHKHAMSHILVQIEGEMIVTANGRTYHLQPGDKLTIPPQVSHAAEFGATSCRYVWVEY